MWLGVDDGCCCRYRRGKPREALPDFIWSRRFRWNCCKNCNNSLITQNVSGLDFLPFFGCLFWSVGYCFWLQYQFQVSAGVRSYIKKHWRKVSIYMVVILNFIIFFGPAIFMCCIAGFLCRASARNSDPILQITTNSWECEFLMPITWSNIFIY